MTKTREKLLFSYFFATFSLLSGGPPKSLFRYFFVTLNFLGFRALWDLLPLTSPGLKHQKSKIQKFRRSENQKCRHFLIFRCRGLPGIWGKKQHLGTWIVCIRQTRVLKSGTSLEKPIFWLSDSGLRLSEVSEFSKPQSGQSTTQSIFWGKKSKSACKAIFYL